MFRFTSTLLLCLTVLASSASAQLFPNAPWNRGGTRFSNNDACPGGVCPGNGLGIRRMQSADPSLIEQHNTAHNGFPGGPQWTWPGDLATHLATEHGIVPQTQSYVAQSSYAAVTVQNVAPRSGGSTGSYAVRSGGSTGSSFYVGGRDHDGALISSVGSTVDPAIKAAATSVVEPLSISDNRKFRRALLEAGRKARDSGEITAIEFFMLSAASRNPRVLDKMQAAVHEAAIEEGLATAQAIDWDSLISFIEKLIPIIIKLIDLFG